MFKLMQEDVVEVKPLICLTPTSANFVLEVYCLV